MKTQYPFNHLPLEDTKNTKLQDKLKSCKDKIDTLLCYIHRDGGHYITRHGYNKAYKDALTIISKHNSLTP